MYKDTKDYSSYKTWELVAKLGRLRRLLDRSNSSNFSKVYRLQGKILAVFTELKAREAYYVKGAK